MNRKVAVYNVNDLVRKETHLICVNELLSNDDLQITSKYLGREK